MTVEKYIFWSNIQFIVNNLNDLDVYREVKWVKNFSFKENLDIDIKIIDNLLKNEKEIGFKPIKPIKKRLG